MQDDEEQTITTTIRRSRIVSLALQFASSRANFEKHETSERLEVLRRADRYEKALAVKDHMVWTALQVSS